MILGVLLSRRSWLKFYGPLIDRARADGHDVRIVFRPSPKLGEHIHPERDFAPWPGIHLQSDLDGIDILITGDREPRMHPRQLGIGQFFDNLLGPPRTDIAVAYLSEFHRLYHAILYQTPMPAQPVTGSPMMDGFDALDPGEIRARYCLDTRPVWLLFTLKFPTGGREVAYREIVEAYVAAAHRQGAQVVAKSRPKCGDPAWVPDVVDRYISDLSMHPFTSLALLRVAVQCLHWDSGAALEAGYAGVPTLCVAIPHPHLAHVMDKKAIFYAHEPQTGFRWEGLSEVHAPTEMLARLRDGEALGQPVSPAARHAFAEKFFGFTDGESARRILEVAQGLMR